MSDYKKMTTKEFKRIFNSAYTDGAFDSYGWEYILNKLSILEHQESLAYKKDNLDYLANTAQIRANIIYDELKERGYYD